MPGLVTCPKVIQYLTKVDCNTSYFLRNFNLAVLKHQRHLTHRQVEAGRSKIYIVQRIEGTDKLKDIQKMLETNCGIDIEFGSILPFHVQQKTRKAI